jgi:hypothetical protein
MKRSFLLVCLCVVSLASFSQKLSFTKGNVVPGKIASARVYEDFLIGNIVVTDENGNDYSFVKADFVEKPLSGKAISLKLTKTSFPEDVRGDIARASEKGTVYTFSNIVVKDKNGKEYKIASVSYEFLSINR